MREWRLQNPHGHECLCRSTEWPLVLFTLATQLACGLAAAATVFDAMAGAAGAQPMRPLAAAIFPLIAAGLLGSLLHLGRPWMSWRAVANLRQSRLSREVLLTAVFAALALAYSACWWTGNTEGRLILGVATSAAGIVAVWASAAVYKTPTRPAWNSGWLPASFLGTTVLLGGVTPALLISWAGNAGILRVFLAATIAGSLLLLVAAFWMLADLSRCASGTFLSGHSAWLGCHVALASVLPVAIAVRLWPNGTAEITPLAVWVLPAVLAGSAAGRGAMYWLGTRYEPF
jgi:anaerobic dimethyl sulfoxide reductase subunit C (anchor subunit)